MVFILYYAVPVLNGVMSYEYFQHLLLLIIALENLFDKSFQVEKKEKIETLLKAFCTGLVDLYPQQALTSGMHELLHLCDCVFYFGPPYLSYCFQFEDMNRDLMSLIKGRDLMGDEFIKLFSTKQILCCFFSLNKEQFSESLTDFLNKYKVFSLDDNKKKSFFRLKNKWDFLKHRSLLEKYKNKFNFNFDSDFFLLEIINFKNIVFKAYNNNRKFNDSVVSTLNNNDFGLIENLFLHDSRVYCLCKRLIILNNPFFNLKFEFLKSNNMICHLSNLYFIEEVSNLKTVFFANLNEQVFIVSLFNMAHLYC